MGRVIPAGAAGMLIAALVAAVGGDTFDNDSNDDDAADCDD